MSAVLERFPEGFGEGLGGILGVFWSAVWSVWGFAGLPKALKKEGVSRSVQEAPPRPRGKVKRGYMDFRVPPGEDKRRGKPLLGGKMIDWLIDWLIDWKTRLSARPLGLKARRIFWGRMSSAKVDETHQNLPVFFWYSKQFSFVTNGTGAIAGKRMHEHQLKKLPKGRFENSGVLPRAISRGEHDGNTEISI